MAWQDCNVTVNAQCGCQFRCLQNATAGHKHVGPFTERCATHREG